MLELQIDGQASGHPVLGAITARVAAGDRICLLGPSGIGKTTLLNGIAGLDRRLNERMIQRSSTLRIGYLFQEHRLLPWRSVRQNLAMVGASNAEIDRLLAQVGLAEVAEALPDQLSLGMARRAALARSLAIKPDLLLLDEPFASLDPDRAAELRRLLSQLLDAHPRMAMICVTHDARDADDLANRLWYLDGAPAELQWDQALTAVTSASRISAQLRASNA